MVTRESDGRKGSGYLAETVAIFHLRINILFLIQGKRNRLHFMMLRMKFNINFTEEEEL